MAEPSRVTLCALDVSPQLLVSPRLLLVRKVGIAAETIKLPLAVAHAINRTI
jgi:hypothetical protein